MVQCLTFSIEVELNVRTYCSHPCDWHLLRRLGNNKCSLAFGESHSTTMAYYCSLPTLTTSSIRAQKVWWTNSRATLHFHWDFLKDVESHSSYNNVKMDNKRNNCLNNSRFLHWLALSLSTFRNTEFKKKNKKFILVQSNSRPTFEQWNFQTSVREKANDF